MSKGAVLCLTEANFPKTTLVEEVKVVLPQLS